MIIGGVQKVSLVDYPGKTCATIFTIGCNMRCGYCHNPELVLPERYAGIIPESEILDFLANRIDKLEGVVVSGGEPTVHEDLPDFLCKIKQMGFLIKLDSNGTNPIMLGQLFNSNLIDFIAMDIKCVPERYQEVIARPVDAEDIRRSIKLIKNSGIGHEFRTTVVKSQISFDDFDEIGCLIKGSPRYALQKFRSGRTLNPRFRDEKTYNDEEFEQLRCKMEQYVDLCVVH